MYNVATTSGDVLTVKYYDDNDKLLSTRRFSKKEVYSNIKGVSNALLGFEIRDEHHKVVFSLFQTGVATPQNNKNKFNAAILATTSNTAFRTWNAGEGLDLIPNNRVYRANITQAGTTAPVATVIQNTLGDNITWQYVGVGGYRIVINNAFSDSDIIVRVNTNLIAPYFITYALGEGSIEINTLNDGEPENGVLDGTLTSIEISTYAQ